MYIDTKKMIDRKKELNLSYKAIADKVTLASERTTSRQTIYSCFVGQNKSYFNISYICNVMGLDIREVFYV